MTQRMSTSASHGVVPEKPTNQVLQSYLGIIPSSLYFVYWRGLLHEICLPDNSHVLKYNKML